MIKLYIRDIAPLFDGLWAESLPLLPPERQALARRFRRDHDAARCVGVWLLLREALAHEGIGPEGLVIQRGAYGKPFLPGGPEFSLSHAGPYAAVAVSNRLVGVDVEAARCSMEMARRCFAADEVEALQAMDGPERRRCLHRLWVVKEAFVKAIGTGLYTPFDSFSVELGGDCVRLKQHLTPLPLRVWEFTAGAYRIAVVGPGEEIRLLSPPPEVTEGE